MQKQLRKAQNAEDVIDYHGTKGITKKDFPIKINDVQKLGLRKLKREIKYPKNKNHAQKVESADNPTQKITKAKTPNQKTTKVKTPIQKTTNTKTISTIYQLHTSKVSITFPLYYHA